jgi:hypothetical protein
MQRRRAEVQQTQTKKLLRISSSGRPNVVLVIINDQSK